MTDINFRSDMKVELIDHMGGDHSVVRAARVSTGTDGRISGPGELDTRDKGLINMLARDSHGVPFEHMVATFRIESPIFVMRELVKHRISSYSEISSRYIEMMPEFYYPSIKRPLVQTGKPGAYTFEDGSLDQFDIVVDEHLTSARASWASYQRMLDAGIAREVARNVLPLSTYSAVYLTINGRSLMNVLKLRTIDERASRLSFPLWEIEQVARQVEATFAELAPVTHEAFNKHGRVAP